MSSEKIELEIVHVLCTDIVGYSKLLTNEQHALIDRLNRIVRASESTAYEKIGMPKHVEMAEALLKEAS